MTSSVLPTRFFDHSRHVLWVRNVGAMLEVLAFEGKEG